MTFEPKNLVTLYPDGHVSLLLTQGQETHLDFDDWAKDEIHRLNWYSAWNRYTNSYEAMHTTYEGICGGCIRHSLRLHRIIMEVTNSKIFVDHINHDTLDNRRKNLRVCTQAENRRNSRSGVNNAHTKSSKYKGVHWSKDKNKWRSKIMFSRKNIHIGYFEVEEDAARAYDRKAIELFGQFAHLNFPLSDYQK